MDALGLIETRGLIGAIVAADTALKAANVSLLNVEIIKGGYVTVQLSGDVAAVKAAVDAGSESVEAFGTLVSAHVIPRMHMETSRLIKRNPVNEPLEQEPEDKKNDEKRLQQSTNQSAQAAVTPENKKEIIKVANPESAKKAVAYQRQELEKKTVNQLRTLVRKTNVMKEQPEKINTSKKAELIHHLLMKNENH